MDQATQDFVATFEQVFEGEPMIDDRDGEWFFAHSRWWRRVSDTELETDQGVFSNTEQFNFLNTGRDPQGRRRHTPDRPNRA